MRFTKSEKMVLMANFQRVRICKDTATASNPCTMGHYWIRKYGDCDYLYRWCDGNTCDDNAAAVRVASLAEIR